MSGHAGTVHGIVPASGGRWLTWSVDGTVRCWDPKLGAPRSAPLREVEQSAIAVDGEVRAWVKGERDGGAALWRWDPGTGRPTRLLAASGAIEEVAWAPEGGAFAVVDRPGAPGVEIQRWSRRGRRWSPARVCLTRKRVQWLGACEAGVLVLDEALRVELRGPSGRLRWSRALLEDAKAREELLRCAKAGQDLGSDGVSAFCHRAGPWLWVGSNNFQVAWALRMDGSECRVHVLPSTGLRFADHSGRLYFCAMNRLMRLDDGDISWRRRLDVYNVYGVDGDRLLGIGVDTPLHLVDARQGKVLATSPTSWPLRSHGYLQSAHPAAGGGLIARFQKHVCLLDDRLGLRATYGHAEIVHRHPELLPVVETFASGDVRRSGRWLRVDRPGRPPATWYSQGRAVPAATAGERLVVDCGVRGLRFPGWAAERP